MNRNRIPFVLAALEFLTWFASPSPGADDAASVFRLMPAEMPLGVVVVNAEKLDKTVTAFGKRLDPNDAGPGLLAEIREQLPAGEWIDFQKPVGFALAGLAESRPVVWAVVPDFGTKVKDLPGAAQEEGVWRFTSRGKDVYAKPAGDYVVAAPSKSALEAAGKPGRSMADEMGERLALLGARDVILHQSMEPVRATFLAQLAQAAQAAPMIGMMLGPQMGVTDPAAVTGMIAAVLDGVKSFAEQSGYVDAGLGMNDKSIDLTLLAGFKDGAIKNYLTKQKPASAPLLDEIEDQPFFWAIGAHVPGDESAFVDYAVGKMFAAVKPAQAGAGDEAQAAKIKAMEDSAKLTRDWLCKIEGMNMMMAMTDEGMKMSGDYLGKDPQTIASLTKETLTNKNSLMSSMSQGVAYEALGRKKLGAVEVEEFSIKIDTSNPMMASAAKMYGQDPRMTLGVVNQRVRFCMGTDKEMERFFSGKPASPLVLTPRVSEPLAALPAKRNAVVLIDLAGAVALLAKVGLPNAPKVPPGPPVAISASLSGDPARIDLHVPLRAIERIVQAFSPQAPM